MASRLGVREEAGGVGGGPGLRSDSGASSGPGPGSSSRVRRKRSRWTAVGAVLIAAALGLSAFNLAEQRWAGWESSQVVGQLAGAQERARAGISPDTPMPTELVDGNLYVGALRIPSLGIELPVMSEWSYAGLRIAPCRYAGSAYAGNMVVAAHNYATHFGGLRGLAYGAEVSFTDVRGNVFLYEVASIETLGPYAVAEMTDTDWNLTLFTCTVGGSQRVTVRCAEVLP